MRTKQFACLLLGIFLGGAKVTAQAGLKAEYFNGQNFDQQVLTRTDPAINFVWDNVPPAPGMDPQVFSIRWTGQIRTPETGNYVFRAHVDDGIRVKVDGKLIINDWELNDSKRFVGEIYLNTGLHDLQVEYFNALLEGEIQLFWQLPSEAPTFGGLLGYNDHLIDPVFFSSAKSNKPASFSAKPLIIAPKESPVQSIPKKSENKPVKTVLKQAVIPKDTLERYLPKNILFEKSKSIMLPESEPELERLAGFLRRNPAYKLTIAGHTDHIGNAAKNMLLSQQRAESVASFLTGKGISAQRITTKGYGDTRPLVREPEGVPNLKNRRVEFFIQE